ncbi:MAG: helix-turn-helix domain-containing protein [Stutzerimonas stutzeri]|jgi:transcriptional regulator with XRE-family HTH domain
MTIGERLKEERNRVGANQTVFAEQCGVTKNTQLAYEKGERSPDANYLAAAAAAGVDVLYVVTGVRVEQAAAGLDNHEAQLLEAFRNMPKQQQDAFLLLSSSIASASGKSPLADKP